MAEINGKKLSCSGCVNIMRIIINIDTIYTVIDPCFGKINGFPCKLSTKNDEEINNLGYNINMKSQNKRLPDLIYRTY